MTWQFLFHGRAKWGSWRCFCLELFLCFLCSNKCWYDYKDLPVRFPIYSFSLYMSFCDINFESPQFYMLIIDTFYTNLTLGGSYLCNWKKINWYNVVGKCRINRLIVFIHTWNVNAYLMRIIFCTYFYLWSHIKLSNSRSSFLEIYAANKGDDS